MTKLNYPKNDFYLDVTRYTFNFLFDDGCKDIVVHLNNDLDKKMMKNLMMNAFYFVPSEETNYVQLKIGVEGIRATYVLAKQFITTTRFIATLIDYAKLDDKKLENLTQKLLFETEIKQGFKKLGVNL